MVFLLHLILPVERRNSKVLYALTGKPIFDWRNCQMIYLSLN